MGLTPAGIAAIRKAGIRSVRVRKSMPFVPLLLLGLAASIMGSSLFIS
jgi:prepilin signal peptidase PulO-like enzyme (type II secretory pathway)